MLTFLEILISHDWDLYHRVLGFLEPRVDEALRDWDQNMELESLRISDEFPKEIISDILTDEYLDQLQFKVILMNSFFLASFALFENHLLRICESVQQHYRCPFSVKELKGSSAIERTKAYFKGIGIPFPSSEPEWSKIGSYRKVRNNLVHEGGSIAVARALKDYDKKRGFADYAESKEIVAVDQIGPDIALLRIELTRQFCEDALNDFKQFLLKLNRAFQDSIKH